MLSAASAIEAVRSRLDGLGTFPAAVAPAAVPPAAASTFQSLVTAAPASGRAANGTWTIMVYITGENLNDFAFDDINEMESALTSLPSSVKIVTAWDQWSYGPANGVGTYATGGGTQPKWGTYGLSVLQPDSNMNSIASQFDLSRGEQNTGNPATLESFIKWGAAQAPADRYILQIWDHGAGLPGSNMDSESGNDALEVGEVADVLGRSGVPQFELLSYDNCLMGMAEIGFTLAPKVAGYFVASEDVIAGDGQDYRRAYQSLVTNPDKVTSAQVATGMVTAFGAQYPPAAKGWDTFSATRTSAYSTLTDALRSFVLASDALGAAELASIKSARDAISGYDRTDGGSAYRDLGTFMGRLAGIASLPTAFKDAARQVTTALGTLVAAKTTDYYKSSGVSIYLPKTVTEYPGRSFTLATYRQKFAGFCAATEWDRFLGWLQTGAHVPSTGPGTPGTPTPSTPMLSVGDIAVTEGDAGTSTANVAVALSAAAAKDVTFTYLTVGGTASLGTDFVATSGTGRIPAGATSTTIPVRIVGDKTPESDEAFTVRISNATNATIARDTATIAIKDNDVGSAGPTVTVTGASVNEGHFGTTILQFTITLASASKTTASVAYTTVNGTATAGEDYFAASGSVTFRPGELSKTVGVRVVGDVRVESDETLTLQLSKPIGLTLGTSAAVGTIVNDDSPTTPSPPSSPPPAPGVGGFQITVTFPDSSVSASQKLLFQQAAARWSEIIVGDLPDVAYQGRLIDDVEISATTPYIDGPYGVAGVAGPRAFRSGGSGLPYLGQMRFDSADMARMERDGTLHAVILHEMGHVLGIGTLWQTKNLVQGLGTNNPIYVGAKAVAEYASIFKVAATSVPVENTGGSGTAGGHWRESVFDGELMTGYAEYPGVAMPLSRITVGTLEDMGYTVDYAKADAYSPPAAAIQAARLAVTKGVIPAGDMVRALVQSAPVAVPAVLACPVQPASTPLAARVTAWPAPATADAARSATVRRFAEDGSSVPVASAAVPARGRVARPAGETAAISRFGFAALGGRVRG